MADNEIKFELNLDAAGFKEGVEGAKLALETMAKTSKTVEASLEFLKEYAVALAAIYAAYKVLSGIVQTVFAAEDIKAVNQQFEILASQAGIVGEELKKGLKDAAGGLIDDTDLLKEANRAIVTMGESASKLPEIMELARKATATMGGDLSHNFEAISQAVSNGNTRMLKHMGIVIDNDRALRDYAVSIGKATSQLTDAERRQAILNAVLKYSQERFQGINADVKEAQNTWTKFVVTMKEVGEVSILAFDKLMGPAVRRFLDQLKLAADDTKTFFQAWFGEGKEKAEASITTLSAKIIQLRGKLLDLNEGREKAGFIDKLFGIDQQAKINAVKMELAAAEIQLEKYKAIAEAPSKSVVQAPEKPVDYEGIQRQSKFEEDMLKLKERRIELEQLRATSGEQWDNLELQRKQAALELEKQEIQLIEDKKNAGIISEQDKLLQIEMIKQQFAETDRQRDLDASQRKQQAFDDQLRGAQNAAAGITAAFQASAQSATKGMTDWGRASQQAVGAFQNRSVNAFKAFGEGSKTASEAAKGFFLGTLSDIAIAQGTFMMLDAFKTFPAVNIPELAAGAALIALGGALGAAAGGGSTGAGGVSAGGGGYGGGGDYGSFGGGPGSDQIQQKKVVTVNVQGNYFETEQTKTRLLELIREGTDATDYKYVQIGGT